jgi:hypothetical protein
MAKTPQARLTECLATIRAEGGAVDVPHIEHMATVLIPNIRANISLDYGWSQFKKSSPSEAQRRLVRAILLVEGTRANDAAVDPLRKAALCGMAENPLRATLRNLIGPLHEDPNGPVYVPQGNAHGVPQQAPAGWNQQDGEGGKFHYVCHLDREVICFGPENPRSKLCGVGFPAHLASGHGRRAYELNRHFAIGEADGNVVAGHGAAPRFVAGFIENYNPLTFSDETGHFYDNFTRLAANEKKFVAIIQALNINARFVHYAKCPSGRNKCPGHSDPNTYPDAQ